MIHLISKKIQINMNSMEEFSTMITHNLRAPITRLLGLTSLLKGVNDDQTKSFLIDSIEKSAKDFDAIIKDLQLMLHAKNNHEIATRPTSAVSKKIDQVLSFLENEIKESNALILNNVSSDFNAGIFDASIFSIFLNLISNSLKFKSEKAPLIIIDSYCYEEEVVLLYKDNGLGIDLTKYGHLLFQRNRRFHPSTEGSGLGLFLVKKQVEEMGGTIEIDSKVGEGTTFRIR